MKAAEVYDDVILGGGCAGLSLAARLAEPAFANRRVLVIEPRRQYQRDRTWCFWDGVPGSGLPLWLEGAVAHRWSNWSVRVGDRVQQHRSAGLRYCEIPADRFYEVALARIDNAHHVERWLGVHASTVRETPDCAEVETDAGRVLAQRVFDSRRGSAPPASVAGGLLQHFVGLRVRTAHPVFEKDTVTLMDFDVSQEHGIHFLYAVPYDPCEALVESTFFSPSPFPTATYECAIAEWLERRHGVRNWTTLGREQGVIPMSSVRPRLRPTKRLYRIGTAGGQVKPSTGYAFLAIQRWSDLMAERMARQAFPSPPAPRSRLAHLLDAMFLSVLARRPLDAPAFFERLFADVPPERLVRFLSDVPTGRDRLAVISALPPAPFLRDGLRARDVWRPA